MGTRITQARRMNTDYLAMQNCRYLKFTIHLIFKPSFLRSRKKPVFIRSTRVIRVPLFYLPKQGKEFSGQQSAMVIFVAP